MMVQAILLGAALVVSACSSGVPPPGLFSPLPGPGDGPRSSCTIWAAADGSSGEEPTAIATAPFVSNPNILTVLFPGEPNEELIARASSPR